MGMTAKATLVLLVLVGSVALMAYPPSACELAGPNTHIGEIKGIDISKPSLTILDRQSKKPFTFLAAPDQLKGLSPGQMVAVKYSEANGKLKAEEITPL